VACRRIGATEGIEGHRSAEMGQGFECRGQRWFEQLDPWRWLFLLLTTKRREEIERVETFKYLEGIISV